MDNLVIVGLGESADLVYEFVSYHKLYNVLGFAVNKKYMGFATNFKGLPVYCLDTIEKELENIDFKVFIAIFWNKLNSDRRKVFEYCLSRHLNLVSLISPSAVIMNASIGKNCLIGDNCVLYAHSVIDDGVVLRSSNVVGYNTHISKHTFMAFGSVVGGNAKIGEQSFIGMNSVVNQNVEVGHKCIIGSGVALKHKLPPCSKISNSTESYKIKTYSEDIIESKLLAGI